MAKVAIVDIEIDGQYIEEENVYVNVVQDADGNNIVSEKIARLLGIKKFITWKPNEILDDTITDL